jgi:hypothetical protein
MSIMPKTTNPRILAAVILGLMLLGIIFVLTKDATSSKKPVTNLNSGTYYDANSGETVSNPTGKGPDHYGVASKVPIYLGLSSLINFGVSNSQITLTQSAFLQYSKKNNNNIQEVSINSNSIQALTRDQDTSTSFVKFKVVFNRTTTDTAQLDYSDSGAIDLHLYDPSSSAQIFDSGSISPDTD